MAIKHHLQFLRAILTKLSQGTLKTGEPCYLTDKKKLAIGDTTEADGYVLCAKDSELQTLSSDTTTRFETLDGQLTNYAETANGHTITANAVAISNADGKLTALTGTDGQVISFNENGVPVATKMPSGGGGGVQKYSVVIGDGSSTSYTLTHNLNTAEICVNAIQNASMQNVWVQYTIDTMDSITLTFASAIARDSIEVIVIG